MRHALQPRLIRRKLTRRWDSAVRQRLNRIADAKLDAAGPSPWLKPKLVAEVKFTEWTAAGEMRHPVFLGLRTDKKAVDVVRELPVAPITPKKRGR